MAGAFEISSSEARRLIEQGGVKLDGETIAADAPGLRPERRSTGGCCRSASAASGACARLSRRTRQAAAAALYSSVLLGQGPVPAPCVKSGESRRQRRSGL